MLYVFHVDSGKMMSFEMNLALERVINLKEHIQKQTKIPADKQVLLVSGGECLDSPKTVCSYSAGTDTNPIFLFSKSIIESPNPPAPTVDYAFDTMLPDLERKMREHLSLPNTVTNLARRAQFAQHLHELTQGQQQKCQDLVHDQHLQQQGWSAVIANLEDISLEFRKRSNIFQNSFAEYISERLCYIKFLNHFNNDLKVLQRIPVLSVLLELEKLSSHEESASQSNEESNTQSHVEENEEAIEEITSESNTETSTPRKSEENVNASTEESESSKEITLFQWISAADNQSTMDQLYDHCERGLTQFNENVFKALKKEIDEILTAADNLEMKEVKGLGNRLSGLETLMKETKEFVVQQANLAHTFQTHQKNANKEPTVINDLSEAHKLQLKIMLQNLQHLWDIRRRCTKAKEELGLNLYHRLRWVMYIEDRVLEVDHKLVIYHENLKRLRRHLEVLQQIHLAPATYLCAVAEVVRRRTFSQSFLLWASQLACHMLAINNDETNKRKEFQCQFEGHFLKSLFPGMDDLPPAFATQAPTVFDANLPQITEEDIERLKKELPDLADNLNMPDSTEITNFFLMKSIVKKEDEKTDELKDGQENIVQGNVSMKGTSEPTPGLIHIKDLDKGCESETDTEEFEKVGQSPLELHFDKNAIPVPRARTQDVSTSTEDNLQISKSEHEKLRTNLWTMYCLTTESLQQNKSELIALRNQVFSYQRIFSMECETLYKSCANAIIVLEQKHKETIETLEKDHAAVLNGVYQEKENKITEIESMLLERVEFDNRVSKLNDSLKDLEEGLEQTQIKLTESNFEIEELQKRLVDKDIEKEKAIKEATDRLNREHKGEIENIRSRFKLMTMEKSPSETNLEKSTDFSSLPSHTTLLVQMTENFEMDKEKAVNEAVKNERENWEKVLNERIAELEAKFNSDKQEFIQNIAKKVSEEKDKQIDILMEREKNLNLECLKYKSTIQQLAETNTESYDSALIYKINVLQKEKDLLEEEVDRLKAERVMEMSTSVAVCEGKIDVMTSPIRQKEAMSKSEIGIGSVKAGKLSIESCKSGDWVIVVWDPVHESFRVAQENKHLYFLHSESLEGLGLEVNDGQPNKLYCSGEVTDKEYCHARKSENRYKVPKGTKFFRVKVRPLSASSKETVHNLDQSKSSTVMSQSQTTSSSSSEMPEMPGSRSLPSSPPRSHPVILERDETDVIDSESPEIFKPESVEQHFAEDSGIVESIEQAKIALDDTILNDSETSDRDDDMKVVEQRTYINQTWLEMMISKVFSKSVQSPTENNV